ncbi:Uncharacterized conserved protein YjiS, DUF1127 family [Aliiroseovarius halocynthiae]|uniref:DUF1127 domain-containing protein n=1 Tax=Aliiroseovarius halocynthiae TaxID=985055 RepID=A0A545SV54_9RHOB|nr:DUF1127 domain-containing protein [Aliiroseovarius halocynthiae]TQV68836.1 DUF1127 domain-containing protein [Aliiroseovarius halocynthiae]SMR71266.1 Uncharacterized conserved protein YjiS, DUF1127 family [Aliiroseovarius halocynthiae]
MAHASEIILAQAGLSDRFVATIARWKENFATRQTYRNTVKELSALSDRELYDLGINRSSIRLVARMAVYGN